MNLVRELIIETGPLILLVFSVKKPIPKMHTYKTIHNKGKDNPYLFNHTESTMKGIEQITGGKKPIKKQRAQARAIIDNLP